MKVDLMAVLALLTSVWGAIQKVNNWIAQNEATINAIVLRVEKESQDGWTNEEKKQFASDMYVKFVEAKVPFYLRPLIKWFVLPRLGDLITKVCGKSHEFKGEVVKEK